MIPIHRESRRDGLVGQTDAERATIAERIARAASAKARGLDGFGVIASIEQVAADVPEKKCSRCKTPLPATDAYFYVRPPGRSLRSECKGCHRRRRAKYEKSPAGRETLANRREERRAQLSEYNARRWAAFKAAGGKREETPRSRLQKVRRWERFRLKSLTCPRRIAASRAYIAQLTAEIDRMARRPKS